MAHASLRFPHAAGSFYPADPDALHSQVLQLLAESQAIDPVDNPKALLAPHGSYEISGGVAASAYACLHLRREIIRRVLVLASCHGPEPVEGLVLPAAQTFLTPLGGVTVDRDAWRLAQGLPGVRVDDRPHTPEHAIEVQLPFLQVSLEHFSVLPVLVGAEADPHAVSTLLGMLWGGPETLIVLSSDLSHHHPYHQAQWRDKATLTQVWRMDGQLEDDQACAAPALNGFLQAARQHRLTPHLLDQRNSGDTTGTREHVVGYAALAFSEDEIHAHH